MSKNEIKTEWITQIHREYENICYSYKIKLRTPVICVRALEKTYGSWDSFSRVLTISSNVITQHDWEAVKGVLKHEMAHQIVSEVFGAEDSHGKNFQRACELIGVPQAFCKASLTLEEKLDPLRETAETAEEEKITRKIKKLLSLAQSDNEFEAFAAMEKVHILQTKYHLDCIQEEKNSDFFTLVLNFKKKRLTGIDAQLAHLLQEHYLVKAVFSESYDAAQNTSYKTIVLLGRRHNVLLAEYVFFFLKERIEGLWQSYRKSSSELKRQYKNSYQRGVVLGFLQKLEALKQQNSSAPSSADRKNGLPDKNTKMLILRENTLLEQFVGREFPKLVMKKSGDRSPIFQHHLDRGKEAGKRIVLNKAMQSYRKSQCLLLS